MQIKWMSNVLIVGLLLVSVMGVGAQSPSVEWDAWNAQITAYADSSQLDVAETQVINVLDGAVQAGQRDYSQPVDIQNVFVAVNGGQPQELAPGQYQVSQGIDGGVILDYQLPTPVDAGGSFVVQINYTTDAVTPGLVDWFVVPGDHAAPVSSSTVTINFPNGQAPDPSFVRMIESNGTVSMSGNSIVVQSQGVIPPNQAFGIQVPFGAGVGAGANPDAAQPVQPSQPVPTGGADGGLGSLLPILCILGVLLLFGGGSLLRNLLGGFGGQSGGGIFGPTFGAGRPFGPTRTGGTPARPVRGFRESANQNRPLPPLRTDKRRGGGASFR